MRSGDQIDFGAEVLKLVDSIPAGKVLSYGDVAALLGSRAARAVGTVMARSGGRHAWWRVVRAGGHPPRGLEEAALVHYEEEGTPLAFAEARNSVVLHSPALGASSVSGYRVDYALAQWRATR
ncbi:hypothetical protein BH09ACT6_BH09ACT6_13760 [soil metagenome]